MSTSKLDRLRVRADRLPAGWVIVLAGFCLQFGLALGLLALSAPGADVVQLAIGAVPVVIVFVSGLAASAPFLLLWRGRYRIGAVLSMLVGAGTLVLGGGAPILWPFPLALFLAAVRAFAGAGLDAETILEVDPDRFERVDPGDWDGRDRESDDGRAEEGGSA
jgi:hypothetical protein